MGGTGLTVFVILLVTGWSRVTAEGGTCQGPEGGTVAVGRAWVADDGCNVCTCTQYGVECQTWKNCNHHNHLGAPGDPICTYGLGEHYTVGQRWMAKDGCNWCECTTQGQMNCTAQPCSDAGFAQPKPSGSQLEFMDCNYNGHIYSHGDHFLADDGCNTCVCILPGNYASFPACTTSPCDVVVG